MFRKIASSGSSRSASTPARTLSGGCLALFSLPFLIAGLFMSGLYFHGFTQWWSARNWEEVPCRIESAKLVQNDGTSSTKASYRYSYQGKNHQGGNVSLYSGSDNIGDFQKNAFREVSKYQSGSPAGGEADSHRDGTKQFRCYVNPANPKQAVLFRNLRWELQAFIAIFALTFPAVGAGLFSGSLLAIRARKQEAALAALHPAAPWKWKPAWTGHSIPEHTTLWNIALHAYTLWSALVIAPLILTTAQCGAFQHERKSRLLFVFVVLWLVPAWFSLKRLRHRLATGTTRFEPRESPAGPGGMLTGNIILQRLPPSRSAAEVTLICQKSISREDSDGTATSTETVWSHTESVPLYAITRDAAGFRIPVSFTIPGNAPESGAGDTPQTKHDWKLQFKVPGTPIHAVFDIPIFRTGQAPAPATVSILDEVSVDLPALLAERLEAWRRTDG